MPFHDNKIIDGVTEYAFENMIGRLQPKAEQLEVVVRRGHAGESLRKTGVRALPSTILTIHYVEDWTAAQNAIDAYDDLIGEVVQVIQHTTDYGYFKVLGVVEQDARPVENVVGSLIATPTVIHLVQWQLISTTEP